MKENGRREENESERGVESPPPLHGVSQMMNLRPYL